MTAIDAFGGANDGFKAMEPLLSEESSIFCIASSDFVSRIANFVSRLLIRIRSFTTRAK